MVPLIIALVLSVLAYRGLRKQGKSQLVSALAGLACFAFIIAAAIRGQAGVQ